MKHYRASFRLTLNLNLGVAMKFMIACHSLVESIEQVLDSFSLFQWSVLNGSFKNQWQWTLKRFFITDYLHNLQDVKLHIAT